MKEKLNNEENSIEPTGIYLDTENNILKYTSSSTDNSTDIISSSGTITTTNAYFNTTSDLSSMDFNVTYIDEENNKTTEFYKSLIKSLLLLFENLEMSIDFPEEEKLLFKKILKSYLKKSTDMKEVEIKRLLEKAV